MPISNLKTTGNAIIASGQQLSSAVDMGGLSVIGFITPAALTSTTLTFLGSIDGVTYTDLYRDTNILWSHTIGTSRLVELTQPINCPNFIKVKSGSPEGADRTITLVMRPI